MQTRTHRFHLVIFELPLWTSQSYPLYLCSFSFWPLISVQAFLWPSEKAFSSLNVVERLGGLVAASKMPGFHYFLDFQASCLHSCLLCLESPSCSAPADGIHSRFPILIIRVLLSTWRTVCRLSYFLHFVHECLYYILSCFYDF